MLQMTNPVLGKEMGQDGNLHFYPRKPKLSDADIIALSLCQECFGTDSGNWFLAKLKSGYRNDFPNLVDILNPSQKEKYQIQLKPVNDLNNDLIHLGYLKLSQLSQIPLAINDG